MTADLIVLGAGPAGVGATYRAARAGHDVVTLERSERPGGAAGSFEVGGLRVDHGSHRLHPSVDQRVLDDIARVLGPDLQRRVRNGRIRLTGRWIAWPLKPADLLRNLPRPVASRLAADLVMGPLRRPDADNFASVLRAGLGPTMCDTFYFPYARKLWGLEPEEISAEQARVRVSASSPLKLLAKAFRGKRSPGFFFYPARGFGAISEGLARAAAAEGADLRFGTEVTGVRLDEAGVSVALADGSSVWGGRLWSTIPIPILARIASPAPSDEVLAAAASLEFRSMLLVYLVLDRPRYTSFDAHYIPEGYTPVTRVSEPKNYRDSNLDPVDRTVLCAEIPCSKDDVLWGSDETTLGAVVSDALVASGLPDPAASEIVVRRLSHAYPVYRMGYEEPFRILDGWADAQPRLLTFGRQGLFVHDNSHHALTMACEAVDALRPNGGFDEVAWASARRRFESHVVED